jgi:hypothetical protein
MNKVEMGRACCAYGERSCVFRVLVGKSEGRNYLEDPGIDEKIIL